MKESWHPDFEVPPSGSGERHQQSIDAHLMGGPIKWHLTETPPWRKCERCSMRPPLSRLPQSNPPLSLPPNQDPPAPNLLPFRPAALSFELEAVGLLIHSSYGFLKGLSITTYGEAVVLGLQVGYMWWLQGWGQSCWAFLQGSWQSFHPRPGLQGEGYSHSKPVPAYGLRGQRRCSPSCPHLLPLLALTLTHPPCCPLADAHHPVPRLLVQQGLCREGVSCLCPAGGHGRRGAVR